MKRLLLGSAAFLLISLVQAQNAPARIDQDTVFKSILARQIIYPLRAEPGAYARIYAGFGIDRKGHVQNVTILNPTKIGYGFEEEVLQGLKRLPLMNPCFEGNYVLPVNFVFVNYEKQASQTAANGTVPDWYFANRTVLNELRRENNKPFRDRSTKYIRYKDTRDRSLNANNR